MTKFMHKLVEIALLSLIATAMLFNVNLCMSSMTAITAPQTCEHTMNPQVMNAQALLVHIDDMHSSFTTPALMMTILSIAFVCIAWLRRTYLLRQIKNWIAYHEFHLENFIKKRHLQNLFNKLLILFSQGILAPKIY